MRSDPIRVITLADRNYGIPLAVMLRSLLDSLDEARRLQVTIIDGGISPALREKLLNSIRSSRGWARTEIRWVQPDYGEAEALPVFGRIPMLTYARINLGAYLPDATDVILLDADVMVRESVDRLWDSPLDGALAGAVVDPFVPSVGALSGLPTWRALGLAHDEPYLNAGVMLIDLVQWRNLDVAGQCVRYLAKWGRAVRWYDQDAINAVLAGRWKQLDPRWQGQPRLANLRTTSSAVEPPWIVHFSGFLKPWSYAGATRSDAEFFEILDRTEWRGWRPAPTAGARLLGFYERHIRRHVFGLEGRIMAALAALSRRKAPRRSSRHSL